jgi:hypothetical protein
MNRAIFGSPIHVSCGSFWARKLKQVFVLFITVPLKMLSHPHLHKNGWGRERFDCRQRPARRAPLGLRWPEAASRRPIAAERQQSPFAQPHRFAVEGASAGGYQNYFYESGWMKPVAFHISTLDVVTDALKSRVAIGYGVPIDDGFQTP